MGGRLEGSWPGTHPTHISCSLTSIEEELAATTETVSSKEQRVRELQAEIQGEEQGLRPGER